MRWIGQIPIGVGLVVTDLPAHALGENLRAAARQRIEPRVHQRAQHGSSVMPYISAKNAISTAVKHFR